ncbi:MAG: DUF2156 domain-containing protein [Lachnospiraceae bacterium]|nr:DUF2156 domain-containing protein [Lachnospiraceae bacterium]
MEFNDITLADKEWLAARFREDNKRACEFCFANTYLWKKVYPLKVADTCGCAILRYVFEDDIYYAFPAGAGDKKKALGKIMLYEQTEGNRVKISGILEDEKEMVLDWYPGRFTIEYDRDRSDYIYTAKDLMELSGRKYHSKRNHIARFKDNSSWNYERLTGANAEECVQMNHIWKKKRVDKWDDLMQEEYDVVKEALIHFEELGLTGGVLRREGQVIAFTLGEPLSDDTFVVHFEKAFPEIQGAYPMINQQFVLAECQGYKYVNREEDTGDEGLRKAKLSYHPAILLDKYTAIQKG